MAAPQCGYAHSLLPSVVQCTAIAISPTLGLKYYLPMTGTSSTVLVGSVILIVGLFCHCGTACRTALS